MSSKGRNPVVGVIKYFEEAPLEAAQAALAGVKAEAIPMRLNAFDNASKNV
jgi:hypothetical protein